MARCAIWSRSASPSSSSSSPTCGRTWCSATTGRASRAPTMRWNAASAGSRRASAASVVARTGTAICCAMGARLPITSGGNRMQAGGNNSSSRSPGSIALGGESFVARPPSRNGSNSRAFVSVTNAKPFSLRLRSAGLPLPRRDFCPHGFKRRALYSPIGNGIGSPHPPTILSHWPSRSARCVRCMRPLRRLPRWVPMWPVPMR